jgi:cytosine/adenosine deaminase-related metal-dependent hydrolase
MYWLELRVARHLAEKQKPENSRCKIREIEEPLSINSRNGRVAKHDLVHF